MAEVRNYIIFPELQEENQFINLSKNHNYKRLQSSNLADALFELLSYERIVDCYDQYKKMTMSIDDQDLVSCASSIIDKFTKKVYISFFIKSKNGFVNAYVKKYNESLPIYIVKDENGLQPMIRCCANNQGYKINKLSHQSDSEWDICKIPILTKTEDFQNLILRSGLEKAVVDFLSDENIDYFERHAIVGLEYPNAYRKHRLNRSFVDKTGVVSRPPNATDNWMKRLSAVFEQAAEEDENIEFEEWVEEEEKAEPEKEQTQQPEPESDEEAESDDLFIDDGEIKDCCWGFGSLKISTMHNIQEYIDQFYNISPELTCLEMALSNVSLVFNLIHSSVEFTDKIPDVIKKLTKFRHDCFAYVCLSSILPDLPLFGTDADLSFLGSKKTPDYIRIVEDKLFIYEFSIVGNILRGNFLKGVDNQTSKYKREIISAESLGYKVFYKPILLSTSMNLEQNIDYLDQHEIKLIDKQIKFLQCILQSIPVESSYLISYSFNKNRSAFKDTDRTEQGWKYEYKPISLSRFLSFKARSEDLTDNFNYNLFFSSITNFISNENGKYTGKFLKDLCQDELELYKTFKELKGKKLFLLKGFLKSEEVEVNFQVHKSRDPSGLSSMNVYDNSLKFDKVSFNNFERLSNKLYNLPHGDLVKDCSEARVQQSLLSYKRKLQDYSSPSNGIPTILNKPRRSFVNILDASKTVDIPYTVGPSIKYSGTTVSVKYVVSMLDSVVFTKKVNYDEKPNDFKQLYQDLLDWISNYVEKPEKYNFKHLRGLLSEDNKAVFDEKRKIMNKAQTDYIKHLKGVNSGVLKIPQDISEMMKDEIDWSGGSIFKLYMGEVADLNELYKVMHITTRKVNFIFNLPPTRDVRLFEDLKTIEQDNLTRYLNEIENTCLFQMLMFFSRVCYSLLAISNRNESSKYLILDNLGLTNTLLIVKGGKKILSTRKSKIFKLIYPANRELEMYNPCCSFNSEGFIEETPWMQYNQQQMLDGMAAQYKYLLNYSSLREKYDEETCKQILFLPTMLLLHNRRKTEINLHNMRYFMVNAISDMSQVDKLIEDFDTPPYSAFDHSLYHNFYVNYPKYFKSVREWKELGNNSDDAFMHKPIVHPILGRSILNIYDFSYIIYSTYMMTKSVDNQTVEQLINMKSIMETHAYYISNPPITEEDTAKLYDSDFTYFPTIAYEVGKGISASIRKNHGVRSIHTKYIMAQNRNIDIIANNRGLRDEGKDFFGHKGYYVVYKKLLDQNFEKVAQILSESENARDCYRLLKECNKSFKSAHLEEPLEKVVFHVVDKVQRGGSREIYVMDYTTKLHQHFIEYMFRIICELVDNEMITISSARRAGHIHHKNFEYNSHKYIKYNLTFDCRKWAPRSNFKKYIDMLDGMAEILPPDFILQVKDFFKKYETKQIHTRRSIKDKLIKWHPEYKTFFEDVPEQDSAFFQMPYSFVMGIFNMLSSLFHAGVQNLAERQVMLHSYENHRTPVTFLMDAHSDDSAGSCNIELDKTEHKKAETIAKDALSYYQHLQKTCNHLMSIKKCNISRQYFELLSILYINNELIPLLPKFLGNFSAVFTGKGISQDFRQVISKSIELQSNGESHASAYRAQIILYNFYRNFYRVDQDLTLPSLGGSANSWPPLYMYFGSAIDEVRLSYTDPQLYNKVINFAQGNMDFDSSEGTFSLKITNVSKIPRSYRKFRKQVTLPEFESSQWFFTQNKTSHSYLNLYWFRAMIDDPSFMVSLLNINEIRRAVDSLRVASKPCIITNVKLFDINQLHAAIYKTPINTNNIYKVYSIYFKNAIECYEDISLLENYTIESKLPMTYKPSSLSINDMNDVPNPKGKSLSIAVAICRPELQKYLFEDKLYDSSVERLVKFLKDMDIPLDMKVVKSFLDFVNKRKEKTHFLYSRIQSNKRTMIGSPGMLEHLQNSYKDNKRIIVNTNSFRFLRSHTATVEKDVADYINACYLYHLSKYTGDKDMAMLPVRVANRTITIASIYDLNIGLDDIYSQFVDCIGRFNGHSVDLTNSVGYALWIDRQFKIMGEWVGKGQLFVKLKTVSLILYINNNIVEYCVTDSENTFTFSTSETVYLGLLLKDCGLNIEINIRNIAGTSIGFSKDGRMGIHKSEFARVGVPCYLNQDLSTAYPPKKTRIFYEYGKHIINFNDNNYTLMTFDYLAYKQSKHMLFDIINWDNLTDRQKTLLMNAATSGTFGDADVLEYVTEELIDKFLNTDLYKMFYSHNKGKTDLMKIIWADAVSSTTASDDILPMMFENTGLATISRILPESKKENLRLLQFFSMHNKILFDLKATLSTLDSDQQKTDYIMKIFSDLGENAELAKLPEIGDPRFFQNIDYSNSDLALPTIENMCSDLSTALESAYEALNSLDKRQISRDLRQNVDYKFIMNTFTNLLSHREYAYFDYSAFTMDTLVVHELLGKVFEDNRALLKFSKILRRSTLAQAPRHPSYKDEWQKMLANFYKYMACKMCDMDDIKNMTPSTQKTVRSLKELERNYIDPIVSLIYETEFDFSDLSEYDLKLASLGTFKTGSESFKMSKCIVEDFVDEYEQDWDEVRVSEGSTYEIDHNIPIHPLTGTVATRYFIPLKNVYTKFIQKNKYYLYNCNADIAIRDGWKKDDCRREVSRMRKFENYYASKFKQIYDMFTERRSIPMLERPTTYFVDRYNLHDPASYTQDLLDNIIQAYDLKNADEQDMKTIFLSDRSPIIKAMNIARILNNKQTGNLNFEKMMKNAMKKLQEGGYKIQMSDEKLVKLDYMSAGKNKRKMLLNATGYKNEFKQLDTILGGQLSDLVTENVIIDNLRKLSILNHLKAVINYYKSTKERDKLAFFGMLREIIKNIKSSATCDSTGLKLEEQIRMLIHQNTEDMTEDEDDYDIFDQPESKVLEWRIQKRG
jgi:hypothetical protein